MKETLEILYEGKSKILYGSGGGYIIRFKDAATAFNGKKKENLAGKGTGGPCERAKGGWGAP